ncbi:hypothetical protein [Corallococcus carmarthensis]|uniref:hypothetical protein n=1 Tax=Corallococcus carmarthensis TaxID=2316728 RepID=UPI0013156E6E|nr:hypothetical protein [Corallococcus carmarthensis]
MGPSLLLSGCDSDVDAEGDREVACEQALADPPLFADLHPASGLEAGRAHAS